MLNELKLLNPDGINFLKVAHFTTKMSVSENILLLIYLVQQTSSKLSISQITKN